jgi:DNA-binding CsgD family transcriptional regulator/tetratricopeptide (TPR) repeat protein
VPRYRILESARQYGQERLQVSGEAELTRRQHAAWFLRLAEEAEPGLRGAQEAVWLERLEREHGNLRAALSWTLERGEVEYGLRLCGALGEFWHARGHLSEGWRWLEAALAVGGTLSTPLRAKAIVLTGYIAWEQGDYERSRAFSEEGLSMSRKLGDAGIAATALANLAWAALYENKTRRASTLAEEAVTLERASGDSTGLARALLILGMCASVGRDYGRATVLHEETLALAREAEDGFASILSLALGAFVFLGLREYGRARSLSAEGLELSRHLKTGHLIATHLDVSAALAGSRGRPIRAARLWGAAEALRENNGTIFSPVERHVYGPYIAASRAQLGEAAWGAAWAEGRTMMLEAAVEYALSVEKKTTSTTTSASEASWPSEQFDKLTRREREVAMLVGRGLTPHQISAELGISKSTVDNHTHNILKMLGLRSRAQIAVWVRDRG